MSFTTVRDKDGTVRSYKDKIKKLKLYLKDEATESDRDSGENTKFIQTISRWVQKQKNLKGPTKIDLNKKDRTLKLLPKKLPKGHQWKLRPTRT